MIQLANKKQRTWDITPELEQREVCHAYWTSMKIAVDNKKLKL